MTAIAALALAGLLLQQDPIMRNEPGVWKQEISPPLPAFRLTPQQHRAYATRFARLADALHAAATFNPPLGIQPRFHAREFWRTSCDVPGATCARDPVVGQVGLSLYFILRGDDGKPVWGGENLTYLDLWVNDLEETFHGTTYDVIGAPYLRLPDGRRIRFMPNKSGEIDGFPVYDTILAVVTRSAKPVWVPVAREEYIRALVRLNEGEAARRAAQATGAVDPWTRWVADREKRRDTREKTYAALKRSSPAKAEEYLATALEMEQQMEAGLRAAASSTRPTSDGVRLYRDIIDTLQAELARMSPSQRASQAWFARNPEDVFHSGLVPEGTSGAKPLVTTNPDFIDRSRPRDEWQVIGMRLGWKGFRWESFGPRKLFDFLDTADWRAVAGLLGPATR